MPSPTQVKPKTRLAVLSTAAVLAVGLIAWALWPAGRSSQLDAGRSLAELADAIARAEPGAVSLARAAAADDWPAALNVVPDMLSADNYRLRAAACEILADRGDADLLAFLIPRASDSDWRVRAATFASIGAFHPLDGRPPVKDTPLDERERLLLAWLAGYDAKAAAPLGPDLCELYAGAAHVEFGRPLKERCLTCHAGSTPQTFAASGACAPCHGDIHRQWAASAHAQSLTHLHLVTIDPATRRPAAMDFGQVRGIGCTRCHALSAPGQSPGPSRCAKGAAAGPTARQSCQQCHATTFAEWQAWRRGRQPRRAVWPPGQLELDHRGDGRTCVDCHMKPARSIDTTQPAELAAPAGKRTHTWAARRDSAMLADGIDLRPDSSPGRPITFALTNLAGHAYPTGTRRRAVRLDAGLQGAGPLATVATFCPSRPGLRPVAAQPSLAPGERRVVTFRTAPRDAPLVFRLIYCRDLADPNAYTAEIVSGSVGRAVWSP